MNGKILFGFGVLLLIGNGIYLYPKYQAFNSDPALEQNPLITELADSTGNMIQSKVGSLILPTSFTEPLAKNLASFEALNKVLHSGSLFRVKLWDTNHTVLWSDASELIGRTFLENNEVTEVLASSERKIEIKRNAQGGSDKKELLTEAFYNNYIELYYPIKDEQGKVVGIVETYLAINTSLARITSEFYRTAALSGGGSILLFLSVFFFARRKSKSV